MRALFEVVFWFGNLLSLELHLLANPHKFQLEMARLHSSYSNIKFTDEMTLSVISSFDQHLTLIRNIIFIVNRIEPNVKD